MEGYNNLLHNEIVTTVIKVSIFAGLSFCTFTWLLNYIGPRNNDQRRNARKQAIQKLELLGKKTKLTEYEMVVASNLVVPEDIDVSWNDIAGLDEIISEIKETIIFPILKSKCLSKSKLARPPKGVLLHGPPGCGKTLIAKATAKQASATFINLDVSMLTDKWYGESQKFVAALFSLAEKLQPSIIFIDEIDSLLRTRNSSDHEATAMMKAQFMTHWDGLGTDSDKIVIVMGATNRPQDLDCAILRRMPATFKIGLPNNIQRQKILKLILENEQTEEIDYELLANNSAQFSGSDLREVCRIASLFRIREIAKECNMVNSSSIFDEADNSSPIRPITMADLQGGIDSVASQF